MKIFKYIFFLILVVIIGSSIYVATLNGNYNIKQTRILKIPEAIIFNNINDYRNWKHWGPWYEIDSTIVASFPEITSGVGASYTWVGADGMGSMKTISVIPNKEIIQQIDFGTGSTPEIYWELNPVENGTEVTWGMRGENTLSEKAYWIFKGGIEKNMTPMLSRGLELLEKQLLIEMDKHTIEYKGIVDYGGSYYLYKTIACKTENAGEKMRELFPDVIKSVETNNIEPSGKPFTLNHKIDIENNTVLFSVCIPTKERIVVEGDVLTGYLAPQKTFKINFKGSYKFLPESWPKFYKELNKQGYVEVQKGFSFEIYSIGPEQTKNPAAWLTEIYIPVE